MTTQLDKARRWRPWQFCLRTLLTLVLAVSCFFGGSRQNNYDKPSRPQVNM